MKENIMQRTFIALFGLAVLSLAVTLGCNSATTDQASSPTPESGQTEASAESAHDHDHAMTEEGESSMAEKMKGLKELAPEDYESAMKQHVCPVSGQMLGSMGAPIKVDVDGKNVWICCDGCRDKLLANPDEYLAKLDRS